MRIRQTRPRADLRAARANSQRRRGRCSRGGLWNAGVRTGGRRFHDQACTRLAPTRLADRRVTAAAENDYIGEVWTGREAKVSASIKDVARQANVSVATVSRALNGHQNVTEPVRLRVLAAANDLRYSPHHAARSLSSRCTQTIGVLLPDLSGEYFSELMRGIDQIARKQGLHLLVSSYHSAPREQAAALRAMRGRVDGVLWVSPYQDGAGELASLLMSAHRAVLINSAATDPALPSLTIDNRHAAADMVRHLAAGRRRRIAFIAGPPGNFDACGRLQGYRDALAEALPAAEPWVLQGDFSEASGHHVAQQLLAAPEWPDAVFAANDMMALGFMFACQQADVDIPGQIAVAGFDDIPLARYTNPTLTTMQVDIAGMGAQAMQMLLRRLAGDGDTDLSARTITPRLVLRGSTKHASTHPKGSPSSLGPTTGRDRIREQP